MTRDPTPPEPTADGKTGPTEAFFDLVTHELRSPLTAIIGYQELLAEGVYGPLDESAALPIARIGHSARHLLHLIDGVIELGRIRSGSVEPRIGHVDTNELMGSAAEAFRARAEERGLEAVVSIPDSLPPLRSDRERLERALELLITSALKNPRDTSLHMEVVAEDDGLRVRITGTEIELEEDAEDPTVRLGLRLAVVRATAELLHGHLDLEIEDGAVHTIHLTIPPLDNAPDPDHS